MSAISYNRAQAGRFPDALFRGYLQPKLARRAGQRGCRRSKRRRGLLQIHEVRYFLALAETLNFTRAAERCCVSQPALTRAIKSLEAKLGAGPLVHREPGRTQLTELGVTMQPYFVQMQKELETAKAVAQDYIRLSGARLRIGLMCTIGPRRLVDLFAKFGEAHEGVDISLVDGPVPEIETKLANGELDVAIYAKPDGIDDRFHDVRLFQERFLVAVGPQSPLAKKNVITIRDLHNLSYLGRANCEFYDHLRRIRLEIGGVDFKQRYTSDRDDWVQCMVAAGLGFTYIPEFAVTIPGLVTRQLVDPEVVRTVCLVTLRGRPHTSAVGAFLREVRRHDWPGKVRSPPSRLEVV
jgi:LysR family hydrogen peroxide-inducible transcriptional activator